MARKPKEEEEVVQTTDEIDSVKLSKLLIKEFNKNEDKSGKIAWCLATDEDNPTDVKTFISTGNTLLNYIISNRKDGGVPVGKLTEISGEEASGKSLVCAHLIAECQRRGGIAVYIDTENSANPEFLSRIGVNIKELVYLQPSTVEDVGEAIVKTIVMARTRAPNKIILVLWDGIAATPCKKELEGDFGLSMDVQLEKCKVISKMMRKIGDTVGKDQVALVFTNQLKVKIGVQYGDPMTTPGGKAVPYAASVRLRMEAGVKQKDEKTEQIYGVHTRVKVVKNRLGPPWRKCEFDILFASGIDDVNSWFAKLHELEEIEKADGWCYLSGLPSGRIEEKGAKEGKDRGVRFREKGFSELMKTDKRSYDYVLELLEKHMIVRYGEKPKDVDLDTESLMDAESVMETVANGT